MTQDLIDKLSNDCEFEIHARYGECTTRVLVDQAPAGPALDAADNMTSTERIYIKFIHKDDVYALEPTYGLVSDEESFPPSVCPKCGDILFVPVELPEGVIISQPLGEMYRPIQSSPDIVIRGESQLPGIGVYKTIGYSEQNRLKQYIGMAFVDENGFELMIKEWSRIPIIHEC